MKQVLLRSLSVGCVLAQGKQATQRTQTPKSVIVITPNEQVSYPVFFEVDEGSDTGRRSSVDPDDMTNEAFWNWVRQQN